MNWPDPEPRRSLILVENFMLLMIYYIMSYWFVRYIKNDEDHEIFEFSFKHSRNLLELGMNI